MTSEGSNLRNLARSWSNNKSIKPGVYNCLMTIADRIDAEMVELPKDADGVPIHVGDTVWGEDGRAWHVEDISLGRWTKWVEGHVVHAMGDSGQWRDLMPEWLTHARPDSWERIADELERYVNDSCSEDEIDGTTASTLVDFADRIRRMAKRDD